MAHQSPQRQPITVQLYIYDLTYGMARQLSFALLGKQLDAVYHTSIVMEGIEYVYDGGLTSMKAGTSHLGHPQEIKDLGKTHKSLHEILEHFELLKNDYRADNYDLWSHNCNSFSNAFALFLVGHSIPQHILNLPQEVLNSPWGIAAKPDLDRLVHKRQSKAGGLVGMARRISPKVRLQLQSVVREPKTLIELEKDLKEAQRSCAVVLFSADNCVPCKKLLPVYAELAKEVGSKAILVLVDITTSWDIGKKYDISSTPTFITFLHGAEASRWSGSEPATLRGNVSMLIQMAWPPHPHESLPLLTLRNSSAEPVLYTKSPPLEKLKAKMGRTAEDPAVIAMLNFVTARTKDCTAEATLPDLQAFGRFLDSAPSKIQPAIMFPIIDLLRLALVDPRCSNFYAEEEDHRTIAPLLSYVNSVQDCPYSLRLVALQMCCNLFSSHLYPEYLLTLPTLTDPIIQLITTSLLDDKHHNVRVAAASLAFNMTSANSIIRTQEHIDSLLEDSQVELAASLLESITVEEESSEALQGFLLALGFLVYCVPKDSELVDLLKAMDAQGTILGKKKMFPREGLLKDIGEVLLGPGLD